MKTERKELNHGVTEMFMLGIYQAEVELYGIREKKSKKM